MIKLTAPLLLCLTIFLGLPKKTDTCTCTYRKLYDRYCKADFAACVSVIEMSTVKDKKWHKYKIRVDKDLKNDANLSFTAEYIYGKAETQDCTVVLQVGSQYLITGHYNGIERPEFNSCNWIAKWSYLSADEKDHCMMYNETCIGRS